MRLKTLLTVAAASLVVAAVPITAAAGGTFGANFASARVEESDFESDDTGWKAHIGGNISNIIGGEIGYIDFGKHGVEGTGADAWTPAITLGVPVGLAKLYAKGGVAIGEFEGTSLREEYKSEDPFYGAGLRIGMNHGLGFRLEYERYQFDIADVDVAMAGLELSFGARD